jgi:hypothetical protein
MKWVRTQHANLPTAELGNPPTSNAPAGSSTWLGRASAPSTSAMSDIFTGNHVALVHFFLRSSLMYFWIFSIFSITSTDAWPKGGLFLISACRQWSSTHYFCHVCNAPTRAWSMQERPKSLKTFPRYIVIHFLWHVPDEIGFTWVSCIRRTDADRAKDTDTKSPLQMLKIARTSDSSTHPDLQSMPTWSCKQ